MKKIYLLGALALAGVSRADFVLCEDFPARPTVLELGFGSNGEKQVRSCLEKLPVYTGFVKFLSHNIAKRCEPAKNLEISRTGDFEKGGRYEITATQLCRVPQPGQVLDPAGPTTSAGGFGVHLQPVKLHLKFTGLLTADERNGGKTLLSNYDLAEVTLEKLPIPESGAQQE